ncbi:alpha/beta fold hydrolase [Streptomyces sp. F8]|uniref:alpha/beta fold hydrolase n=1 Tax=Streptomyces sp. F8 TaxID=1436085 RepID=UPI0029CF08B5|nr:alpha/beta fold hydrolase [Streptomyces sp. F8]MDX6760731.1 alpha/beta fold hydrolase [Streptomyces sp. F8]
MAPGPTTTIEGDGEPLVLVHGSWTDHHSWNAVLPHLTRAHRVLVYDRRGHSLSERPPGQGTRTQDEDDLAALIEMIGAPVHVAASVVDEHPDPGRGRPGPAGVRLGWGRVGRRRAPGPRTRTTWPRSSR